jgi:hypothetical protein
MGANDDYWFKVRARGVCTHCRRPMPDDDPRLAHTACSYLQSQRKFTHAQIRAMSAEEIVRLHSTLKWTPLRVSSESPCR